MDAGLLVKLFGSGSEWKGPCTVVLDADANVTVTGTDSVVQGGAKMYAPRTTNGRVEADAVCLLPEVSTLVIVVEKHSRAQTGEEQTEQKLTLADFAHIAAIEFDDLKVLGSLGLKPPHIEERHEYRPGTLIG